MSNENNTFYVVINGMDLTGKTTLANNIKDNCIEKDVQVLRSSFSSSNPLNALASKLRKEREKGEFSQNTIKELFKFASTEDPVLLQLLKEQFKKYSVEVKFLMIQILILYYPLLMEQQFKRITVKQELKK